MRLAAFHLIPVVRCLGAGVWLGWVCSSSLLAQSPLEIFKGVTQMRNLDLGRLSAEEPITARYGTPDFDLVLATETFMWVPLSPEEAVTSWLAWNPSAHPQLGVRFHRILTKDPAEILEELKLPERDPATGWLVRETPRSPGDSHPFHVTPAEAAQLTGLFQNERVPENRVRLLEKAWRRIMLDRWESYHKGGILAVEAFTEGGEKIELRALVGKLLQVIPGVLDRFRRPINLLLFPDKDRSETDPALVGYVQLLNLRNNYVFVVGGIQQMPVENGRIQMVDFQFFVSARFYAALTFYEFVPFELQGRPGTLIWRNDHALIPVKETGKGIARAAAESVMGMEVMQSMQVFHRSLHRDLKP